MNPVATYSRRRIPALLLLSFLTTSCAGQGNATVSEVGTGESQPAPASRERLTKTQGTSPYDNVHCGLRDKAGNLWFGTTSEGVYLTTKDGLGNNSVFCIVEDDAGRIWFGTRNVGVCRYDGKMFTEFSGVRSQP